MTIRRSHLALFTSAVALGVIACSAAPGEDASSSSAAIAASATGAKPEITPAGNAITWLPQYQFDNGAKPAVAMGGFGNFGEWTIEVHQGVAQGTAGALWSTSTTSGFKSNTLGNWDQFGSGENPAIANLYGGSGSTAFVLAVAQFGPNPGAIFDYVGQINIDGGVVWTGLGTAASGFAPTLSAYNGVAVEAHMKTNVTSGYTQLYYTLGTATIGASSPTMQWGASALYDNGVNPSVAVWGNTVVEVHQAGTTAGALWYHVGTIANGAVAWGPSRQYDSGVNPSIAFSNEGVLVEVHQAAVGTSPLWYHVGTIGASQTVNWSASYNYDTGNFPSIAWDQKDDIGTEMHQADTSGVGALWAHPFYLTCPAGQVSFQGKCTPCGAATEEACVTGCNSGTILSGTSNTCAACGTADLQACAGGCDSGYVLGYKTTGNVCVTSCGKLDQLACAADYNDSTGGCTQLNTLRSLTTEHCEWRTDCGRAGQGACEAGNAFQSPNGTGIYNQIGATQDVCFDGSDCSWQEVNGNITDWQWMCYWPNAVGGSSGSGGAGACGAEGETVCASDTCHANLCNAGGYCEPPNCAADAVTDDDCYQAFCTGDDARILPQGAPAPVKRAASAER